MRVANAARFDRQFGVWKKYQGIIWEGSVERTVDLEGTEQNLFHSISACDSQFDSQGCCCELDHGSGSGSLVSMKWHANLEIKQNIYYIVSIFPVAS